MTNFTDNDIRQIIGQISDPDLNKTLAELGAIRDVKIADGSVSVDIALIQPIHWISDIIMLECRELLAPVIGDSRLEISFTEILADTAERPVLPDVKNIIAVASGKGGVGKSAIAANIAASLSLKGAKVGILDGDVYGPSQPTMFGLSGEPFQVYESDDGNIAFPNERYGIKIASMGFMLSKNQAAILRGPMLAGYFSMLFEQLVWGDLDFLVFDLPPGTGDIQLTMTQKIPLTGAVIVTTPQEISVADVRRSIAMFEKVNVDILGIVENMSYFVPPDMPDKKYYIFGKDGGKTVAHEFNSTFLGEVPLDMNMRETNDSGKPLVLHDDAGLQGSVLREITAKLVGQIRRKNFDSIENPLPTISI